MRISLCVNISIVAKREGLHSYEPAGTLLRTIGSPARLAILRRLAKRDHCVHEIVTGLGISQPLASQHLRVLRGERLVSGTRIGKEMRYRLMDVHISRIVEDAIRHARERSS
jgi:ArsR family transcriptional regulator, zinc-responsive transcriptional repressor